MGRIVRLILLLLALAVAVSGWLFFGPATGFEEKVKFLYIPTAAANRDKVLQLLKDDSLVSYAGVFDWLAEKMDYWKQVKPGKYKISSGATIFHILSMLKNGEQTPVNLIITKIRTKEDLASIISKRFECDSASFMAFLSNPDTLSKYDLNTNTVMTAVFPETYTYFWNTTPSRIFHKLYAEYKIFWTDERKALAREKGLTPQSAYTLASIIEEETNRATDKPLIASVYLNRLKKGMPLQADPTVKFAMHDFGLKRIYTKYTRTVSPYNTYMNKGLPPGPICTPSAQTLEATLQAPVTNYIFFVAKPDFSGYSNFAATAEEHAKNAKAYQTALDKLMETQQNSNRLDQQ